MATPALTIATVVLHSRGRTGIMRTPQREFLNRCGPWATPALGVWVVGGGDLAGQFADAGLLDELWVQYAPVTLGAGAPLLPRHVELRLEDVVRNRDFACARYTVLHGPPVGDGGG